MCSAVAEGHGDAAVFLLQNGAEHDKQDRDGNVALALSPDDKVRSSSTPVLYALC